MQRKADSAEACHLTHGDALARALRLDISAWFTPTAESYFTRVSKGHILAAIDEAKGSHAPALEKLKKAELAARAEALVAGTSWLPAPLRIAVESAVTSGTLPEAAEISASLIIRLRRKAQPEPQGNGRLHGLQAFGQ